MKIVATHNGKFHPDDVFAVASIMLLEGKENVSVIRTRDEAIINTCDWVVDVGSVYEPERLRFDHHQSGSLERENGIQYAAFGLIWLNYGEKICGTKDISDIIEKNLVLPIDAHDVGVSLYTTNEKGIHPVELFDVIYSYVPAWQSELDIDAQFLLAVDFAYEHLKRLIVKAEAKVKMKAYAKKLYDEAVDKTVIESELGVSTSEFIDYGDVTAVMSPDANGSGNWIVSVVPIAKNSFEYAVHFPVSWGGLQGEELEKVSGITGAIFCHKNRFLFVGSSREAVIKAIEFLE